jgi:hypothetical protein
MVNFELFDVPNWLGLIHVFTIILSIPLFLLLMFDGLFGWASSLQVEDKKIYRNIAILSILLWIFIYITGFWGAALESIVYLILDKKADHKKVFPTIPE